VKDQLVSRGAGLVFLRTSFRATPAIQRFVNAAFAPVMREDRAALQAGYVPLAPARADHAAQPAVVALPVPRPYGRYGLTKSAVDLSQHDAVAAFVAWLLRESGWTVTEREKPGEALPIAPRHVCLLFRRFTHFREDVTRPYVEALEARGIPHLLVGGRSFHLREEVESLRTALAAIEWPDDELAVFATLRGSLFAICSAEKIWRGRPLPPKGASADARKVTVSSTLWPGARFCGPAGLTQKSARAPSWTTSVALISSGSEPALRRVTV